MILVPNHQLLLNGSKFCLLLFFTLLLTDCSAFQVPQQGRPPRVRKDTPPSEKDALYLDEIRATRVYDPIRQEWVLVPMGPAEKMDTIQWIMRKADAQTLSTFPSGFAPRPAPAAVQNILKAEPEQPWGPHIVKKEVYQVAVALPFLSGISETSNAGSEAKVARWAINYYAGMKLATPLLEEEGIRLQVHTYDTRLDSMGMEAVLNQAAFQQADVVIGPYKREHIRQAADFAQQNQKVLVSPFSAVSNLTKDNPGFIQVNPSLESHCRALLKHALQEFAPNEILIVTRNNDLEKLCVDFLQSANRSLHGADADALRTTQMNNPTYAGINIAAALQGRAQVAVMVPSWADQNFIFFLLRRIEEAKKENQKIVVYGMPQWMEYENFEYEFFERLHVRVSSQSYLDQQDESVQLFRKKYFDAYGTVPDLAAFQGYDAMLYVGRMLQEFGKYFPYFLDKDPAKGLEARFEFYPVRKPDPDSAALSENIQYFENRFLHILEFRDFQFQLIP